MQWWQFALLGAGAAALVAVLAVLKWLAVRQSRPPTLATFIVMERLSEDAFDLAGGPAQPPPGFWAWYRTWLRRRRRMVASVTTAVVVVAGTLVIGWPPPDCGGSHSGVREIDGECIGVTDGSYSFHETLTDVEKKIAMENATVSGSRRTVTIALLDPLTANETSAVTPEQVSNELEGAYTAQYQINHTRAVGDAHPLVKLVLANWGSHELQSQTVVEQLADMVNDPEPLVAVVGLRPSTVQTKHVAELLAHYEIPMVSTIASADQLNYGGIQGFLRVSPSDSENIGALKKYLQQHPDLDSAIMVNPGPGTTSAADLFTLSLRDAFNSELASLIKYPAQSYVGTSGPTAASPHLFTNITANICAMRPKVVLYAGRVVDFPSFLQSLQNRPCSDTPLTVLGTGTDFGALQLRSQEAELQEKNITIAYATATDAQGWVNGAPGTPPFFKDFYGQFRQLGFDPAHLDEGSAISSHDALFIAAKAARLAALAHPDQAVPNHRDVLSQMLNLNGLAAMPGAAGTLSFSFRGENSGNPSNKPIPVIEVPSTATAQTAEVYLTE